MNIELTNRQAALVVAAIIEKRNKILSNLSVMPTQFISQREDLEKMQSELADIIDNMLCTQ